MSQDPISNNMRRALDEALRCNDYMAAQVEKLETEAYTDYICGLWRLSDTQTVHIRKIRAERYSLCVWAAGKRLQELTLLRIGDQLCLTDAHNQIRGGVYYFPETAALLIETLGFCTAIEKDA